MRLSWLWPVIIILSAVAAGLLTFVAPNIPLRLVIVLWFLLVCPGMGLVQSLRLQSSVIELTLALALSLAIDAIVAGIPLYAGKWSPPGTLEILMGLSIGGVAVLFATTRSTSVLSPCLPDQPIVWDLQHADGYKDKLLSHKHSITAREY